MKDKIKRTINFAWIGVLAVILVIGVKMAFAAVIAPISAETKLKSYADTNFKTTLNYENITIKSYYTSGNISIISLTIDGKDKRWITSKKNFNLIIK